MIELVLGEGAPAVHRYHLVIGFSQGSSTVRPIRKVWQNVATRGTFILHWWLAE
jgi:hypothetical protein